jgi:apolipoprotein N-acyltransferase
MKSTDASANETLLIGEIKLGEGKSIYSQLGDWMGWSCLIIFTFSLIILLLSRKRVLSKVCF